MIFDYLFPVDDSVIAHTMLLSDQTLGHHIDIHSKQNGVPELEGIRLAIVGVCEGRRAIDNEGTGIEIDKIRKQLYQLFPGSWITKIADLGNILQGQTVEDTYFALREILSHLLKQNIIPIIIGGGQDLTYANYRAYDTLEQTVNIVSVDNKFDFGSIQDGVTSQSYLSTIVMEKPNNLFNYSNIGYQTFFNPQEEIDLVNNLFFDAFRLGEVAKNLELVEPILRDADIVSIDLSSIRNSEAPANNNATPNGFYGEDICAISRYAGISDKVSSFGIYEFNYKLDNKNQTAQLIAQSIWYFIEGVNCRANDYPFGTKDKYQKFIVPIDDEVLNFYKSNKSGRWWMEINFKNNNKYERHSLIPCTYQDYLSANDQEIPDRWYKTLKKVI
ncbi:formimidoylglutamase [Urechidicola croceus]|uniref:Arginase n=1 Tax=Urechidicola croceus TaxID=1850246 RepID=A0A1D8PAT7_9FLAO|nr:formimidoylglutamase [Urechidicola croceus]AOW21677.1 arginase [Urechidicola croceus]